MNKGRFFSTWLLFTVLYPRFSKCDVSCQPVHQNHSDRGDCPIRLTSVAFNNSQGYFENITFRVWMKGEELCECPKIEIRGKRVSVFRPVLKKDREPSESHSGTLRCENNSRTGRKCKCNKKLLQKRHFDLWELKYYYSKAEAGTNVSIYYVTSSSNCSVTYQVSDPRPDFSVKVNKSARTISVAVDSAEKVNSRLCYKKHSLICGYGSGLVRDPEKVSKSVVFNITYLLPCLCVEVYYTYRDARRRKICPFENKNLLDAGDVLRTSKVTLYNSEIKWGYECPATGLNLSASLCWKLQEHLCIPVPNSVLKKTDKLHLMFNTSGVDVHPQMCVTFSLQDKHNISCLYQNEKPGWEADIGAGRQSMVVHLTSSTPGNFSAQLCVLTDGGCTPVGPVHSVAMKEDVFKKSIEVPVHFIDEKPCVQVWKSDPALIGRRILCLDYTRNRSGTYIAAAVMAAVVFLSLGMVIRRVIKSITEDWLVIQKPLLLVCSSDQSTHVSAVCALASILHGKLGATVHTALWAQSSQKPSASGAGVADLGPVPWLYGQWEAVCKAQGKVLIVWSPEAKKTYERWRLERRKNRRTEDGRKANPRQEKIRAEEEELLNGDSRKVGKWKKAARKKDAVQVCDEGDRILEKEPSAVIEPVFVAALASLEGALRGCKDQQVAIVYFQGLCHRQDIPKDLRGVSRYCLPQDFSGLLQELGMERGEQWPRLPSKLLSTWLARRLARRLQTLLLQMKGQNLSSSAKMTSGQKRSRFGLPARSGDGHKQELLQDESPRRREEL